MSSNQPIIHLNEKTGQPFDNKKAAEDAIVERGFDRARFVAVKVPNGWGIEDTKPVADTPAAPTVAAQKKYAWVTIIEKSNAQDLDTVPLSVNGYTLQVRRGMKVPLPADYIEVLDHAEFHTGFNEPGNRRKALRKVKRYPFSVHPEPCTEKDFTEWLTRGNAQRDADLSRQAAQEAVAR